MKTALKMFCIAAIIIMMAGTVFAGSMEARGTSLTASKDSATPVLCGGANTIKPVVVAGKPSPCPGKVYCNNPNTNCGEYCCEWGYFYSNPCTCRCYKSSSDAGADCNTYFRCN